MRSRNRLTIEAVEATRRALEERIDRLAHDTHARMSVLEASIQRFDQEKSRPSSDSRPALRRSNDGWPEHPVHPGGSERA